MHIPNRVKIKRHIYLLILAAICIVFCLLAKWQVTRAHEKQQLFEQLSQRLKLPPTVLTPTKKIDIVHERFLPVLLHGHYLNQYNFLLDNQQQNKQSGYKLLTPFQLTNSQTIILINRGWLPRGFKRTDLPAIPHASDTIVLGYINNPASGILIGKNIESTNWPIVIQKLDFNLISEQLGVKIADYVVQLTTIDYIGIGSSKHWGYAVQWAALAVTVLVYMIFLAVKKWN